MPAAARSCARPDGTRNAEARAARHTTNPTTKTPWSASAIGPPDRRRWAITAPITESPIAPPTVRKNCVTDVAAPRSSRSTALCTAMSMGTIVHPIPTPAMSTSRMATAVVRDCAHRVKSKKAPLRRTIPAITRLR